MRKFVYIQKEKRNKVKICIMFFSRGYTIDFRETLILRQKDY